MSRFQEAVEKSPEIKDAYCAGLTLAGGKLRIRRD